MKERLIELLKKIKYDILLIVSVIVEKLVNYESSKYERE